MSTLEQSDFEKKEDGEPLLMKDIRNLEKFFDEEEERNKKGIIWKECEDCGGTPPKDYPDVMCDNCDSYGGYYMCKHKTRAEWCKNGCSKEVYQ